MKTTLNPDDERLSAYALDEMSEADRKAFENELDATPDGQQLLDEVVDSAAEVREMFRMESIRTGEIEIAVVNARDDRNNIIRPEFWTERAAWITAAAAGLVAAVGVFSYIERLEYKASNDLLRVEIAETQIDDGDPNTTPEFRVTILRDVAPQLVEAKPIQESTKPDQTPKPEPTQKVEVAAVEPESTPASASVNSMTFENVRKSPESSFTLAIGDSSYAEVQKAVATGKAPARDAVRIEELVNHFDYDYAQPENPAAGIAVDMEVAECPWNSANRLVRIGLRGSVLAQVPSAAHIDVEFNPYQVRSYRLIGSTGGESETADGARPTGRSVVTALYEIELVNPTPAPAIVTPQDLVSTGSPPNPQGKGVQPKDVQLGSSGSHRPAEAFPFPQQLLTLKLGSERAKIQLLDEGQSLGGSSADFRFAAAVAAFGMRLSGTGQLDFQQIAALAEQGLGEDAAKATERRQFVQLAKRATKLERK